MKRKNNSTKKIREQNKKHIKCIMIYVVELKVHIHGKRQRKTFIFFFNEIAIPGLSNLRVPITPK